MSNCLNPLRFVVAIPVRNERERIGACLQALAEQTDVRPAELGCLLFLNNCTDDTADVVARWLTRLPLRVRVIVRDDPAASAGWARAEAMNAAAAWLDETPAPRQVLLTTDADSRVPNDWVALNAAALDVGADAAAGRIVFDPADLAMLPQRLRERQVLELEYDTLLAEIEARLAPRRYGSWPRHSTASGASIAVRLEAFRQVGGVPAVDCGEDRAFIDLLRASGLAVRHAPEIVVTTSGRLEGRAQGGAAETLKRRSEDDDSPCDVRLQPLISFVIALLRERFGTFSAATVSARRCLRPSDLPLQMGRARVLLSWCRALEARRGGSRRFGSRLPARSPERLSIP